MTTKECRWCKDEFCVNDKCPMCADYCPTVQYPGVCKYEELVDVEMKLAPKGCLMAVLMENGVDVTHINVDKIYDDFVELMVKNDNLKFSNDTSEEPEDYQEPAELKPGVKISLDSVTGSSDWEMSSFNGRDLITYVTKDGELSVTFERGEEFGTIVLNH